MILVTGGAGYIGSHTVVELLEAGHEVLVLDDLSNSVRESLNRVEHITGKKVIFVQGDIADKAILRSIFSDHSMTAVMHFAGFKAVGESVREPLSTTGEN
ncbi:hypothetical protein IDAT_12835 [Pseudidiomarina atlantica]|uniref:UDP-glucose 4-epimerase n=1 Tax=Pseudidiomarina atlantica TaxID=1517416 RepID=A0A094J5E8_9GAMM|nr:hypothetical protein IDAT_12835 [Pseudidiomarina atlantica]